MSTPNPGRPPRTDLEADSKSLKTVSEETDALTNKTDNEANGLSTKTLSVCSALAPPAARPVPQKRRTKTGQQQKAYTLWHERKMDLDQICQELRSPDNPLKRSTVMLVMCGFIYLVFVLKKCIQLALILLVRFKKTASCPGIMHLSKPC